MKNYNHTGTDLLRKGRQSIPGARYFITVCTEGRKPGLAADGVRQMLVEALRELHRSGDFEFHCATIMPDHVHTVFTLGRTLTLSQTQGKFKSLTNDSFKARGFSWQENYYDHRIRHNAFIEPFARYTFLNPYRKKLLPHTATWPGWVRNRHYRPEFMEHLINQWRISASGMEDGRRFGS